MAGPTLQAEWLSAQGRGSRRLAERWNIAGPGRETRVSPILVGRSYRRSL